MTLEERLRDPSSRRRIEAIEELATTYLGRCTLRGLSAERVFLRTLEDPDAGVQDAAFEAIAKGFEWWSDSPIGPVRVHLRQEILKKLIEITSRGDSDARNLARVGDIVGRLAGAAEFEQFSDEIRENRTFQEGMLDGLCCRESGPDEESMLRFLLQSNDAEICRGALSLL